jgi:hypothetical protein
MSDGWGGSSPTNWPANSETHSQVETEAALAVRAAERDAAIMLWQDEKTTLALVKENEANARQKVTDMCFPTPVKGTQRFELGKGYKLKLVHGWTYTLGESKFTDPVSQVTVTRTQRVDAILDALEAHGDRGKLLAERLITWEPSLCVPEYEMLNPAEPADALAKELIDAILIVKPASPQLTLEEPKAAK